MRIGYARVSTGEQILDLQQDALTGAGCDRIFTDKLSSVRDHRPGLEKALELLRAGDTLVVWRLDRLGRSLRSLIDLMHELSEKGVGFASITEAIDTTSSGGKLIFHIFGALAEFERDLIRERTLAGLQAARARGRRGGRPRSMTPKQADMAQALYQNKNNSIEEICRTLGISRSTLYRYVKTNSDGTQKGGDVAL